MDYNNYYPVQVVGHHPTPVTNQHGSQQQQPSPGGQVVMHAPMAPQNIRQAMPPGPPSHHQHQQMQQHQRLGHLSQQMPTQQQQHPSYHQIQPNHPHGPPVSHSRSPHPQQQQQQQQQHLNHNHHNHQATLSGPTSQQTLLTPQQHHLQSQSPHHHHGGPPMHMQQQPQQQQQQQQQLNHMVRTPPLGPSVMNHPQTGLHQHQNHHHHQNFYTGGKNSPIPSQSNLHHYTPQQNQHLHHPHHQTQNHHHHHHQQQQHDHQPPQMLHSPQLPPQHPSPQIKSHGVGGGNSPYHPNIHQTEFRIIELNRKLQCRPIHRLPVSPLPNNPYDESLWWERFASEFFEDDATLTIRIQDDKPIDYTIGRTLIPRFFRSYFDGGVTELSINLRNSKELKGQQVIVLECEHANIVTKNILKHPKVNSGIRIVVCTEGHLSLEFVGNDLENLMIKSWKFRTNVYREYIDRSITGIGLPSNLLMEPTTFHGLPNLTMTYLSMCSVMEPMQELMSQHKLTNIEPRACLKKLLFEIYRFKSDDDNKVVVNKRRKRKPPAPSAASVIKKSKASANLANATTAMTSSISPPEISNSLPPQPPLNVLVVGEPSSMGAEYRDDNERSIDKIENSNYIPPIEPAPIVKVDTPAADCQINQIQEDIDHHNHHQEEEVIEKESEETVEVETKQVNEDVSQEDELTEQPNLLFQQSEQEVKEEPLEEEVSGPNLVEEQPPQQQSTQVEEPKRQVSEEPLEKENNSFVLNDETHLTNSTATQSENHYNIMNSIPEDREDTCRSTSCDSLVSKLPPSSNNKNTLISNGSSNKHNRRRSSERKETLREGLMRTSDFVVAMKDLKCEHPALWRITTGNNLLQQFEPKTQNGVVLYENTNQYAGWNPEIKKDYVGVDVKLTQHTRNQITVERLLLNFQKLEGADQFFDKHFVIYLQILISTALDPKFWESIENEPEHHDYFITSRRIIEDITKRFKIKLSGKLKLSEASLKNVEKYPNLLIKPIDKDKNEQQCRACNTNLSTQQLTFGNRSYDLHSYKPVKVTSELSKSDDKDLHNSLCDACLEIVKLYSEIHHVGWKLYNIAREKVELHRTKGKPINAILDECLKDNEWMSTIYAERDALWSKIEYIQ